MWELCLPVGVAVTVRCSWFSVTAKIPLINNNFFSLRKHWITHNFPFHTALDWFLGSVYFPHRTILKKSWLASTWLLWVETGHLGTVHSGINSDFIKYDNRIYNFNRWTHTLIRGTVKLNGSIVLLVNLRADANSTLATSHLFLGKKDKPWWRDAHRWWLKGQQYGASSVTSKA